MGRYQRGARERGIPWDLNIDDFERLTSMNCYYCGVAPSSIRFSVIYNGLDRVDSKRGYELDNVVPACKICNNAKKDLPYEDFMIWIARLARYQRRRDNHSSRSKGQAQPR